MLFDQPAWAERLQQMGVGRRLDPKEFEARGAVDYLVRQLRYVSMDEGVRASCELWKRTVLEEADGLGAVLAAIREAEIEAEIEAPSSPAEAYVEYLNAHALGPKGAPPAWLRLHASAHNDALGPTGTPPAWLRLLVHASAHNDAPSTSPQVPNPPGCARLS